MAKTKGEIVAKKVITREKGYLYVLDKDGNVLRFKSKNHDKQVAKK